MTKRSKIISIILSSILALLAIGVVAIIIVTGRNKEEEIIPAPIEQTIHFNVEGVEGLEDVKATPGETIALPTPEREGYTFVEWRDAEENGNVVEWITMPTLESGTTSITLYGVWSANEYTITYKDEGGEDYSGTNGDLLPTTHTYGTPTELVDGVKGGYGFIGWFSNPECSGERVETLGATEYTSAITLYAKWTPEIFTTSGNSITGLTSYGQTLEEVIIPSEVNGVAVTSIANNALKNNKTLTSVILPSSVTRIGDYAFYGCSALTSVEMPNVTSVGTFAFAYCSALASITMPNVTSIGERAFYNCYGFIVYYGGTSSQWSSLSNRPTDSVYVAYYSESEPESDKTSYWHYVDNVATLWEEPTEIYTITSAGALSLTLYGKTLTTLDIPSEVNSIAVTSIEDNGFQYCHASSITLPSSVTSVGQYAFQYCSNLTSITMPNVTSIGNRVFQGCSALTSITMPNVTSIGQGAFYNCSVLTSIEMPSSVTRIGSDAFAYCSNLKRVYYKSNIASWCNITFNSNPSYNGADLYIWDNTNEEYVKVEGTLEIPSSVTQIKDYAFYNCKSITNVILPSSVTSIGDYAFYQCSALTSVEMPNVTSVGSNAFSICSNLASITMPNVTSIGSSAFDNCKNFIVYYGGTSEDWSSLSNRPTSDVYVAYYSESEPESNKTTYWHYVNNVATLWEEPDIYSITSAGALSLTTYGKTLTTALEIPSEVDSIAVTSIADYGFQYCHALSITLPSSVTRIGNASFRYCSALASITMPSSVTSIGSEAFSGCSALTTIEIPSSVTSIGNYAFYYCRALTSIEIPSSVTSIGQYTFYYCSALTSIEMPNVTSIGYCAFGGCSALTSIEIPSSVTSIDSRAFSNCSALTSITMPNVTSIGSYAFYNCSALESIEMPNVTSIGNYAFQYCSALTTVIIGTAEIANGLTSQTAQGYIVNYATTIYIKEGLDVSNSTYLNNNFHTETSDKAGYVKYVINV